MNLIFNNVNDAFRGLVIGFKDNTFDQVTTNSRNGPVRMIPYPVVVTYKKPLQRVLFNPARDANPFFHLYESLWMLAGRNDVTSLKYYNSNISNYSDDGETFNGAYGYRWRHSLQDNFFESPYIGPSEYRVDQLQVLVEHLKQYPESRRAVLQMWNVEDDLLKVNDSKDVCCNLSALFSIRREFDIPEDLKDRPVPTNYLDMTVFNRSNDMIWGMLGANVVHFSFLQEYMAACLGVEVGVYHQVTNNLHVYLNDKWKPEEWLANDTYRNVYPANNFVPLVNNPKVFDQEVQTSVDVDWGKPFTPPPFSEDFLRVVATPMCRAFYFHKQRNYKEAFEWALLVEAEDWRVASCLWILKRKAMWEAKQQESV